MSKIYLSAIAALLFATSACTPHNETPQPENPSEITWIPEGWNDSLANPNPWYLGETFRMKYNADKTLQLFINDTLQLETDNDPSDLFRFIYENGRLSRLTRNDHYFKNEFEHSVIRYNPDGSIHEIDMFQQESTGVTQKVGLQKYHYNAFGKLVKMESFYKGKLGGVREFQWAGNDITEMAYTRGYNTDGSGGFTTTYKYYYDLQPSPEHLLLGSLLPIMRYHHYADEYYIMSEHRLNKSVVPGMPTDRVITYTYSQNENGQPLYRFAKDTNGSGGNRDWDEKRVYLYKKSEN